MGITTAPPSETEHGHAGIILATLTLANVMGLLDQFVVNVALHDIGTGFHHSLSAAAWVLNAYALFFGALLVPAGRLADKFGRKNTFMLGLAIFTTASVACTVSPGLWALVGFRCIQATGAAMLIPASLGLVLTTMPPERVKTSVRLWAVGGAAAGAIGPVVGGLLTALSWRWIFFINLPIGIAAIVVTWKLIPNVRHDLSTKMPDPLGILMVIIGIGAISLALLNGSSWGWGGGRVVASWAVAAAAIVIFVASTRRAQVPVVDPKLFRSRVFSSANVSIILGSMVFAVLLLSLSYFFEQSWHWSTIETGLGLAPGPVGVILFAPIAQKLNEKFPVGLVTAAGFAILAAGQVLIVLCLQGRGHSYAADILPGYFIMGIGFGFTIPTIIGSATHDLPHRMSATGSAVINSGRQVGGVLGTAILVVIIGNAALTGDPAKFYHLWWVAAAACGVAALTSLGLTPKIEDEGEAAGIPLAAASE